jgi:hypothetical protein
MFASLTTFNLTKSSTGLGTDGKDASCIIEEVIADRGSNIFVETLPTQGEKKMQQGNSGASTGPGETEEVMLFKYLTGVSFQLDSSFDYRKILVCFN